MRSWFNPIWERRYDDEETENWISQIVTSNATTNPIYTPEYSPGAAAQLAQLLKDFEYQP